MAWNPETSDPELEKPGPFEPSAVMRMHRAGVQRQNILNILKLRGTQLLKQLETSKIEEADALKNGRPIHNALIEEEK